MEDLKKPDTALVDNEEIGTAAIRTPNAPEPEPVSYWEGVKANIKNDNLIYNIVQRNAEDAKYNAYAPQEGFNPIQDKYLSQLPPDYWPNLLSTFSDDHANSLINNINEQLTNKDIAMRSGKLSALSAGIINGVVSPLALVGISQGFQGVKFGSSFIKGFFKALPSTAAIGLTEEAALYANQQTRTLQESAINATAMTIFGGVIAGTGSGLRALSAKTYKSLIDEAIQGSKVNFWLDKKGKLKGFEVIADDSGGSRRVKLADIDLNGWGKDGKFSLAKPLIWTAGKFLQNPVVKGLMSKSKAVRKFIDDGLEHNLSVERAFSESFAKSNFGTQSLQTIIYTRASGGMATRARMIEGYFEYLGLDPSDSRTKNLLKSAIKNKEAAKLHEFDSMVWDAYIAGGKHENPTVARMAQETHKEVMSQFSKDLKDLGYDIGDSPFGAEWWLGRNYDRDGIVADRVNKTNLLEGKFRETNNAIKRELEFLERLKQKLSDIEEKTPRNKS